MRSNRDSTSGSRLSVLPWELARRVYARRNLTLRIPVERTQGTPLVGMKDSISSCKMSRVCVAWQTTPNVSLCLPSSRFVQRVRGDVVMAEAERRLIGNADRVVATSEKIAEHLTSLSPMVEVDVFPNGFDAGLFAMDTEPHPSLRVNGVREPCTWVRWTIDSTFQRSFLASSRRDLRFFYTVLAILQGISLGHRMSIGWGRCRTIRSRQYCSIVMWPCCRSGISPRITGVVP